MPDSPLHLLMRNTLASVELGEPFLNLGEKDKPLDGVVDSRVRREVLQRFENAI